ncbi:MAG: fused MFS/spermidine synthase [Ignavibacteria bacterium]
MRKENLKTTIYLFFVLSGMTGLIFQISWFKYLSLFLGNTTYAQVIVLSTFLGGLAIGNYLFGRISDQLKNHLKLYGLIELLIGLYCLLFPLLSNLYEKLFLNFVDESLLDNSPTIYLTIKIFIAIISLILPTTLMGGTLPILTNYFTEKIENIRKENANLYFLNSFGAVVGIFFAGFVLIKTFGLDVTIKIGGVINIFVGLVSLFISSIKNIVLKSSPEHSLTDNETESFRVTSQIDVINSKSKTLILIVVLIAALSGFASLLYEVLWTRILITVFGSSTYSFSIMLLAFISGITIGSFVVSSNFISRYNRFNLVIFSQIMIALTILIALYILPYLPYYFWKISTFLSRTNSTFPIFLSIQFLICFVLIFIPTIFMGMTLPLIVEIVSNHLKLVGFSVGKVFSMNTFGNVLGSFSAGLIFIPLIGIKNSFLLGIGINVLAANLLLLTIRKSLNLKKIIPASILLFVVVIGMLILPDWNQNLMLTSVFRRLDVQPPPTYNDFKKLFDTREVIYYKDGISGNTAVIQTKDKIPEKILLINGKPDASSLTDMPTQLLLGHIPMLLHKNPKNVFVIGFGSGSTVNAILKHNPDTVICSEISKEVIEASKNFSDVNENCLLDKRVKIINEDAQSYLRLVNKKFDVIISEPSNPWIAGIGNLFSKEYFERCKLKLNKDGLMCQWFHIYEMDDDVLTLVISTFNSVFPYVQIWGGTYGDLILIGSENKIEPNFTDLKNKISDKEINNSLSIIGINNVFTFLTTQILSPEGSFILTDDKHLNSERKPTLEFLAPIAFYKGSTSMLVYQNDEKFDTLNKELLVKKFIKENKISEEDTYNAIKFHISKSRNLRFAYGLTNFLLLRGNSNPEIAEQKFQLQEKMGIVKLDTKELSHFLNRYNSSNKLSNMLANQVLAERINSSNFMMINNLFDIEKIFLKNHNSDKLGDVKFFSSLANIFLKNSNPKKAIEYCYKVENILKDNPHLINQLDLSEYFYTFATSALYTDNYEKVIEYFIQLINYNQNYPLKKYLSKRIEWKVKEDKRQAQKSKID